MSIVLSGPTSATVNRFVKESDSLIDADPDFIITAYKIRYFLDFPDSIEDARESLLAYYDRINHGRLRLHGDLDWFNRQITHFLDALRENQSFSLKKELSTLADMALKSHKRWGKSGQIPYDQPRPEIAREVPDADKRSFPEFHSNGVRLVGYRASGEPPEFFPSPRPVIQLSSGQGLPPSGASHRTQGGSARPISVSDSSVR